MTGVQTCALPIFGDKINVLIDIPENLLDVKLPNLTIQPLVEKLVKDNWGGPPPQDFTPTEELALSSYQAHPMSPPSCVSLPPSLSRPSRSPKHTKLISLHDAAASH